MMRILSMVLLGMAMEWFAATGALPDQNTRSTDPASPC